MSINWPHIGEKTVGEYQVSAIPFVTSSTIPDADYRQINFGYVTSFIVVKNSSTASFYVGFTSASFDSSNVFSLDNGSSFSANLRTDRLFLSGTEAEQPFELVAGLTGIPQSNFLTLTASNGYNGVG